MFEPNYLSLVSHVISHGEKRETRAGPTRSIFGGSFKIDELKSGQFPILTTRRIYHRGVVGELAAFIQGATHVSDFKKMGCNYWDLNAAAWSWNKSEPKERHEVGRIYGAQWRHFFGISGCHIDQLKDLVYKLKTEPNSRRHLLTSFNPAELPYMCLPPCHLLAQFNVTNSNRLDCMVYMRSVDLCLGLPSDIVLYATLQILLAYECDMNLGSLQFSFGDMHVYENHIEEFNRQVQRRPKELPSWVLKDKSASLFDFDPDTFTITNYEHHDSIPFIFNV